MRIFLLLGTHREDYSINKEALVQGENLWDIVAVAEVNLRMRITTYQEKEFDRLGVLQDKGDLHHWSPE